MRKGLYLPLALTLLISAGSLFWLAGTEDIPVTAIMRHISLNLFPYRNENFFILNKIRGREIFAYAYIIMIVSSVAALFIRDFLLKKPAGKRGAKAHREDVGPHPVIVTAFAVFFITAVLQLAYQGAYFSKEIRKYAGKTEAERLSMDIGEPYDFAMFCRRRHPGHARGEYISDLDAKEAAGLATRYRVAYHIFPINISIETGEPVGAYVVFRNRDPRAAVPPGFRERHIFDRFSLIAIKDGN